MMKYQILIISVSVIGMTLAFADYTSEVVNDPLHRGTCPATIANPSAPVANTGNPGIPTQAQVNAACAGGSLNYTYWVQRPSSCLPFFPICPGSNNVCGKAPCVAGTGCTCKTAGPCNCEETKIETYMAKDALYTGNSKFTPTGTGCGNCCAGNCQCEISYNEVKTTIRHYSLCPDCANKNLCPGDSSVDTSIPKTDWSKGNQIDAIPGCDTGIISTTSIQACKNRCGTISAATQAMQLIPIGNTVNKVINVVTKMMPCAF